MIFLGIKQSVGPHRDDLQFFINEINVADLVVKDNNEPLLSQLN